MRRVQRTCIAEQNFNIKKAPPPQKMIWNFCIILNTEIFPLLYGKKTTE